MASRKGTLKRRGVLLLLIGLGCFVVSGLMYVVADGTAERPAPTAFTVVQGVLNLAGLVLVVIGIITAVVGFASRRE